MESKSKELMSELSKALNKERACQVYAVIRLENKEQDMIDFLKEKMRTVEEIAKKMLDLVKESDSLDTRLISLLKQEQFTQNERVNVMMLLDKFNAVEEKIILLNKLKKNEMKTHEQLGEFVSELIRKYK